MVSLLIIRFNGGTLPNAHTLVQRGEKYAPAKQSSAMTREQPTTDWHRLDFTMVWCCTLFRLHEHYVELTLPNATHQGGENSSGMSFWPSTKKENSVYLYVARGIKFQARTDQLGGNSGRN